MAFKPSIGLCLQHDDDEPISHAQNHDAAIAVLSS